MTQHQHLSTDTSAQTPDMTPSAQTPQIRHLSMGTSARTPQHGRLSTDTSGQAPSALTPQHSLPKQGYGEMAQKRA